MKNERTKKFLLLCAVIFGTVVVIAIIYGMSGAFFKQLFILLRNGDEDAIYDYINGQTRWVGMVSVVILCILQVASIILPSLVIHIAAALIYNWPIAFILCWVGFVLGNALVFAVARLFGNAITDLFNIQNTSWIMNAINSAHPAFVVALACMVPGLPNGIIPYVAARSKITFHHYVFAVAVSSWPQIMLNCMAAYFFKTGDYFYVILTIVIQVILIAVVTINRDRIIPKDDEEAPAN